MKIFDEFFTMPVILTNYAINYNDMTGMVENSSKIFIS